MTRTHWILTGLLVAQVALLAIVSPWSSRGGAGEPQALAPALAATTAGRVEIRGDEGKTLTLARADGAWTIGEADGYPADAAKVDDLLGDLKGILVRRPVVTSSRYHATLNVTELEAERRIRVFAEGAGDPVVDLLVGSSPNYGVTHVRLAGDDRVYEVRDLRTYDIRPDAGAWIDRKLVEVPAEDVTAVTIRADTSTITLTKAGDGWSMTPSGAADSAKIDTWIRGVTGILISEPAGRADGPAFGFDAPAATVELSRTKDGAAETVTLRVGAEVPGGEGTWYARRDRSTHAVVLSSWDAEKLLRKKPADFAK